MQFQIRKEIKRQIKESVDEKNTQIISFKSEEFARKELEWQNDNEFLFNGELFDVVKKIVFADGSVKFCCVNDKQEKALFAKLDEFVKENLNNGTDKTPIKKAIKNLVKEYWSPSQFTRIGFFKLENRYAEMPKYFYTSFVSGVTVPPPELG